MENLSDGAKVLHAVITNLCEKNGYCFASNAKLGELCGVSARTIQRRLKELEVNLVTVNRFFEGDTQKRNIFLNSLVTGDGNVTGGTKSVTPPMTNSVVTGTKSVTHNRELLIEDINREDKLPHKQLVSNIPTWEEFLSYCIEKKPTVCRQHLKSKYDSWAENNWKDGHDKKIKNWKSKILNTMPYLNTEKVSTTRSISL